MRITVPAKLEAGRVSSVSEPGDGIAGAFNLIGPKGAVLRIVSSGPDHEHLWEHVSVSVAWRTPNWDEMCWVKDLFWNDDECVVQYHPPRADHVNHHPFCLHLWKPFGFEFPRPPSHLVGPMSERVA